MKKLLFLLLLMGCSGIVRAQSDGSTVIGGSGSVTTPDIEAFSQRCHDRIVEFQRYISDIANPNTPDVDKQQAIEQTLGMFLKGSTIQVSSVKNPKKVKTYSLNDYLQNLSLLGKHYKLLEISCYRPVKVSDFIQSPDGTWSGVGIYFQSFKAVTKSGEPLGDRVAKRIETFLKRQPDPFTNEEDWMLLLGNISVVEVNNVSVN